MRGSQSAGDGEPLFFSIRSSRASRAFTRARSATSSRSRRRRRGFPVRSSGAGPPVVTLASGFLRGRITYALYRQMGVEDLIATDVDDYVERAVRLANDRAWREEVRATILASNDKIFENPAGVRDLESFLVEAVESQRSRARSP